MRAGNRGLLLRLIWQAETTTRASLARETGLSRSATSTLVEELIAYGLVADTGPGVSRGGRRPTMVQFEDASFLIVGIDLGATHVSVVVTDLRGRSLAWRRASCAVRENPEEALATTRRLVAEALAELEPMGARVLGAGMAVASPVNPRDPGRLLPLFMPAWRDVDLMRDLKLPGDPPLLIDNDANLGALAETWWGAGRGGADLVFIKLGTGIGAGLVLDGRIFRGSAGTAGEIGHLVIDPHGPPCVCGLQGCLTTLVGTPALLATAERRRADFPDSLLPKGTIELAALIDAVKHGDRLARAVVSDAAEHLGQAVAGLLNLVNPQTVVLGGEIATVGDALLHPLRTRVQERSVWTAVANTRIVASELGARDVALGAATQVLQAALADPTRFPVQWES